MQRLSRPLARAARDPIWQFFGTKHASSRIACSRCYTSTSTPSNEPHSSPYPFRVLRDVSELRAYRRQLLFQKRTVGLVPTMGALHQGHLSLVATAARENTDVFISIFVNPTQFGPKEDLATYPRTWDTDMAQLVELTNTLNFPNVLGRVSAIFAPTVKTMYPTLPPASEPEAFGSFVTITPLGNKLEGASRPTFFRGVATVCTKLFNIIQPDRVYFGQKDVQQTAIIRRMVQDFQIPTDVRVVPTMREADGLAMSSRNVYLGRRRRAVATVLSRALFGAQEAYERGVVSRAELVGYAHEVLNLELKKQSRLDPERRVWVEVDYVSLADYEGMDEVEENLDTRRGGVMSAAIRMLPVEQPKEEDELDQKSVRLIDNVILAAHVA